MASTKLSAQASSPCLPGSRSESHGYQSQVHCQLRTTRRQTMRLLCQPCPSRSVSVKMLRGHCDCIRSWPCPSESSRSSSGMLPIVFRGVTTQSKRAFLGRQECGSFECSSSAVGSQVTSTNANVQQHVADLTAYLKDVAAVEPPLTLPILLHLLHAQGYVPVDPSQRKGIVPLLVPVAQDQESGSRLALLRWPTPPEGLELPLVSINPNNTISLLARSCLEYINRALAEEDASTSASDAGEGTKPLAQAVAEGAADVDGTPSAWLYQAGDFAASKLPRIEVFLLKKVGPFPDVMEQLALGHLKNGDEVSALVTGEFYASPKHFPGFGRPFIFNAELLARVGRTAEARDAARIALRSPWWTLGVPYQEASDIAGYGDTLLEYAQERVSDEGRQADIQKGKSPAQVSLDQAAFLMDVATADNSWDQIRERLATLYEESGLPEVAHFVRSG